MENMHVRGNIGDIENHDFIELLTNIKKCIRLA